jgi:Family of unknown function (DUF5681)
MDKDYTVGYGKPPQKTRFPKGSSGNSKGRPKGTKNLKTDLAEELAERIPIREGKRTARISKQRAVVKMLISQTLKGDGRAAATLVTMMYRLLDHGTQTVPAEEPMDAAERDFMAAVLEDLRTKNDTVANEAGDSDPKEKA